MEQKIEALCDELRLVNQEIHDRGEFERRSGQLYNIFSLFSIMGDWPSSEAKHSIFIADLLNPGGTHGAGDKFLRYFLNQAGINDFVLNPRYSFSNITERYIGEATENEGGRIDIIFEDGNNALIIENKIYAADQQHQLIRYYNYANVRFKNFRLIYLTLDGHEPSEDSAGKDSKTPCLCISYRGHIIPWLERCIANANARVGETIKQYRDIIRLLTNQNIDMEEKQEIIDIARNHPQEIALLFQNSEAIQQKFIKEYVLAPICKLVEDRGWRIKICDENKYVPRGKRKHYPHWFDIYPTGWVQHSVAYEYQNYQIIGVTGKIGHLLPCFKDKSEWYKMGYVDTADLMDPASFPSIVSGKICKTLCNQILIMVEQAENQARDEGFQL